MPLFLSSYWHAFYDACTDSLFKRKLNRNIIKYNKVALCFHCLKPMEWYDIAEREIQITPSHRIMLFCKFCHVLAETQMTGRMIENAFRRWFNMSSGLPVNLFDSCFDNVLTKYGWGIEPGPIENEEESDF